MSSSVKRLTPISAQVMISYACSLSLSHKEVSLKKKLVQRLELFPDLSEGEIGHDVSGSVPSLSCSLSLTANTDGLRQPGLGWVFCVKGQRSRSGSAHVLSDKAVR